MSANRWITCEKCKKELEEVIKKSYGKIPEDEYNLLKNWFSSNRETTSEIFHILDKLGFDYSTDNESFSSECETVSDYGDGEWIDEEGNWNFHMGASCERCGNEYEINIKIPPNKEIDLDLTKSEKNDKNTVV